MILGHLSSVIGVWPNMIFGSSWDWWVSGVKTVKWVLSIARNNVTFESAHSLTSSMWAAATSTRDEADAAVKSLAYHVIKSAVYGIQKYVG